MTIIIMQIVNVFKKVEYPYLVIINYYLIILSIKSVYLLRLEDVIKL